MSADQFGVKSTTRRPIPYGVVVDWNVGRGVITFTAFSSGDASMYTSAGGAMIGGVGHESVKDAAQSLVRKSAEYVPKTVRSDDVQSPSENNVRFFILTNQGRFVAEEDIENFDNGSSELLELFVEANKLIAELRVLDEQNQR